MTLFLCEKPSQARDIGRVLGATARRDGYLEGSGKIITWCLGHLLEMTPPDGYKPEWKSWQLETLPIIPDQWLLHVRESVSKQFDVVQKLLHGADVVVLATDADREGETIGREILERCRYRGKILRLWLSALDDTSIRKALASLLPGEKTLPLYLAGMGRARADWLVGMNLSRAYTIIGKQGGYDGVLTVGRVQTPTLKLVVDRDRLIENFKPVTYFEVLVDLQVEKGRFKAKWLPNKTKADAEGRCLEQKVAAEVAAKVQGQTGHIQQAETKRVKEPPPLPLDLSTLQQEASRRWSLSAKKGLDLAQALYEKHKAITYPRSDSRYLPIAQFADAPRILAAMSQSDPTIRQWVHNADPSIRSKAWNDKKITAHHAIIPTSAQVNVAAMSREEGLVYDLIRRYYLVQFFKAFEYDQTVVQAEVQQEMFRASGRVEKAPGWKQVLRREPKNAKEENAEDHDAQALPAIKSGEAALVIEAKVAENRTKPPDRYTEGTLVQAMKTVGKLVEDPRLRKILRETSGIGTEATRANIIENLLKRKLLANEGKKNLLSTSIGRVLVDMLPESVTNPATTAVWEQTLDDIAHAGGSLDVFLGKSVSWVSRLVSNIKAREMAGGYSFIGTQLPPTAGKTSTMVPTGQQSCPQCSQPMQRRKSSRGWFWGCSGYPQCQGTLPDGQSTPVSPANSSVTRVDSACPQCNTGKLLVRVARKGQRSGKSFFGCSQYPQCRYTKEHTFGEQ